jgi:hypothetical protein
MYSVKIGHCFSKKKKKKRKRTYNGLGPVFEVWYSELDMLTTSIHTGIVAG